MKIQEHTFAPDINAETQAELLQLVEQASSLEDIFDVWFLEKGNRLGLGVALDDDGSLSKDLIALYFDTGDGREVCSMYLPRAEVKELYPDIVPFDSFVGKLDERSSHLPLKERKYNQWMKSLGFTRSYALMSRVGPRRAAIPVMLSFALSSGGTVEAHHLNPDHFSDEDYSSDLVEEGIEIGNYFNLYAMYSGNDSATRSRQFMLDPLYCHKAA